MKNILFLLLFCLSMQSQTIKLGLTKGGTYEVPVKINETLQLPFILDTGCSETSIPSYVLRTLIKNKTVVETDFLESKIYTLADGTQITAIRVIIKSLKIADKLFKNVAVSVNNADNAPLLLGQNVLSQFGVTTIDYKKHTLKIN